MSLSEGRTQENSNIPPLFRVLLECLNKHCSAIISVIVGEERTSITVIDGRVISVSNTETGTSAIIDLLERVGLLDRARLPRAERIARKRGLILEDALVAAHMVSGVTMSSVKEFLCRESILSLLLNRDADVSVAWSVRKGIREHCVLPIPFLLREAQRRAQEMPAIRRVVSSTDAVFARVAQLKGVPERWEELRLSARERQVYFFIDGRRNVKELALATCQSEFDVSRSIMSLVEQGLVKPVTNDATSRLASVSRSTTMRAISMLFSVAVLLILVAVGTSIFISRTSINSPDMSTFHSITARAPERRIEAALGLYEYMNAGEAKSFQDLLAEGLVLASDIRAAVSFKRGGESLPLYPSDSTSDDSQEHGSESK